MLRAVSASLLLFAALPGAAAAAVNHRMGSATPTVAMSARSGAAAAAANHRVRSAAPTVAVGIRPSGAGGGEVAKTCIGLSVPVYLRDPRTHRQEKYCRCADGADGRMIKDPQTHAPELHCTFKVVPIR